MTRSTGRQQVPSLRHRDRIRFSRHVVETVIMICGLSLVPITVMAQFAPQAPLPTESSTATGGTVAVYSIGGRDLDEVARQLRERFANRADVRIAPDPRTGRILVHAPDDVHHQLQERLRAPAASLGEPVPATSGAGATVPSTPPRPSAQGSGAERREIADQLQNITWRQLIAAAQQLSTNRLSLTPDIYGQELTARLPSRNGETTLRINPQTGAFQLEGTPELTQSWLDAIRILDQRSTAQSTQLVPISGVSRQSIDRAVKLLQSAPQTANPSASRWGADVVGIQPANRHGERAATQLAQAQPPTPPLDQQPAPPDPQPEEPFDEDETVEIPLQPAPGAEDVGLEGALIGPVQIEYVEGLDAIVVKGRRADVERVMRLIEQLELHSQTTQPAIELIELQHVNSESMAEVVTQLNLPLTTRLGTVSITPLVKPNALMLIGRRESVDETIKLIQRLDVPVAPTSQFSIFRLQHLPATDAAQTINTFFADRGGLGPRIQVQADFRTNSIIVYASPRDLEEVRQLLKEIDVTENAATSEVRVFKLRNALAEELAPMLEATLRGEAAPADDGAASTGTSGRSATLTHVDTENQQVLRSGILTEVRVSADVRANSLIVTAPAESMELIASLIQQLDELPRSEAFIRVFPIDNGDAFSLRIMLEQLFGIQTQQAQAGPGGPGIGAGESSLVPLRLSVDPRTNSIIATGGVDDLRVVESILVRLDLEGASRRQSRVFRLQNAPAPDVALAINQTLVQERQLTFQLAPDTVSPFQQIEREIIVVPEIVSNSLIVSATPPYFERIERLITELDAQPPMVMVQVLIASVRLDNQSELGVELGLQDSLLFDRSVVANNLLVPGFNFNNLPLGNSSSPASLATRQNVAGQGLTSLAVGRTNSELGYGGLVLSASSESVSILIRALQQTNRLEILSSPTVTTINNLPAYVQVGQQVPFVTDSSFTQFGQTNAVELVDVGILLGVTPRISLVDDLVVMEINAVKSELSNQGVPISIGADGTVLEQPIIDTTRAETTVSARNGQTVVLGGLITKTRDTLNRSVPYLGDIPVLGSLFRFDSVIEQRTELLIIMTPYIIRHADDADVLNQIATQRMSWCLADVFDVYGDIGPGVGGLGGVQAGPKVIHPDKTPTANGILPQLDEEIPSIQQQAVPPIPPANYGDPSSAWDPDSSLPFQPPSADQRVSNTPSSNATTVEQTQRRWRDRLRFGRSRATPTQGDGSEPERREVAPVQYLKPGTEPPSWETDRRRLPSAD